MTPEWNQLLGTRLLSNREELRLWVHVNLEAGFYYNWSDPCYILQPGLV